MNGLTDYQAKYLAHELTLRARSDSVEKLATALADAQVDLNPHQVEAALFAFNSPLSKGAILADEVGLGKTIEAGLLLSQKWAERKRRLLVIVPANLRKQWSQELADKFHLPSAILETRTFNAAIRAGNLNPFQQDAIVLCSYQFARAKDAYVHQTSWDLVVVDEAHRLRNVYKPTNKIANAIKTAIDGVPKVLLTATPLQNSLLELYGLVSVVDEHTFGDLDSFRDRYTRGAASADFVGLKERLRLVCKRTLRRQVLEYVKYTNRHAIVQEFYPNADEQRLYDLVSDYLQKPVLHALPASQRQLMTLILRKLIASSTYAISGTLDGLVKKLEAAEAQAAAVDAPPDDVPGDVESFDELADEWDGDEPPEKLKQPLTQEQLDELRAEMAQLREFHALAESIVKNSKGDVLLTALRKGFDDARRYADATLQPKAVIFTESRHTQEYLLRVLEQTEFSGKVMLFNGTNSDPASKAIYRDWLVESGVDFEKRIAGIYQKCRTEQQISFEFDALQHELGAEIAEGHRDAREKLLNNFDQEVIERVRMQSHAVLDRFNDRLWQLTRHALSGCAAFNEDDHSFVLHANPFPEELAHPGPYRMGQKVEDANTFRVGHVLAQRIIAAAQARELAVAELTLAYTKSGKKMAVVEPLVGARGWMRCERLAVNSIEPEDYVVCTAVLDGGRALDVTECRRLLELPATVDRAVGPDEGANARLGAARGRVEQPIMDAVAARNSGWFDAEMDKLDRWAEDRRQTLKAELDELDVKLRDLRKAARSAPNLPEKLERQRDAKRMEAKRDESWRDYDRATRDLESRKNALLDEVGRRMLTYVEREELFTVKFSVV